MSRIDALYEAAQNATPGPWSDDGDGVVVLRDDSTIRYWLAECDPLSERHVLYGQDKSGEDDARYIALADPQTVMALVKCFHASKRALIPDEERGEALAEFQDEQGGCNFYCNSTGFPHREQHAADCPLVLARAAIQKVEALDRG